MKSLLGKLGVILIGLAIFGNAEVWGADWSLYGIAGNGTFEGFYDAESIMMLSKNIVRVADKKVYTEKGVVELVENYGKKYENVSHSIVLWEINCEMKMVYMLSLTYYSKGGEILFSQNYDDNKWIFIPLESMIELLFKAVCK